MRTLFRIISSGDMPSSRPPRPTYCVLQRGRLYIDPQQVARSLKRLDDDAADEERMEATNKWPRIRTIARLRRDRNIQANALVEVYEMSPALPWDDFALDGFTGTASMVKLTAAQFRARYRPKTTRPGGIW